MKLKTVSINNFMSISTVTLNLDNPGLHLILGVNKDSEQFDSNGSGKSSMLDAIIWALYGEILRPVSIDSLVHNGAEQAVVSVEIDTGDDIVTITRTRFFGKKSLLTVTDSAGSTLFPSNSITDMQQNINDLLGLDFKTFTNSVYFGKGLSQFFMLADDKTRKDILEAILQLVDFDTVYNKVKERFKETSDVVAVAEKNMGVVETMLEEKNSAYTLHYNECVDIKAKNTPVVEGLKNEVVVMLKESEDFSSKIVDVQSKIQKFETDYNNIKTAILNEISFEKDIITANSSKKEAAAEVAYQRDIDFLTNNYNTIITTLTSKQDIANKKWREVEDIRTSIQGEMSLLKNKLEIYSDDIALMKKFNSGATCGNCQSVVTEEHKTGVIKRLTDLITDTTVIFEDAVLRAKNNKSDALKNKKEIDDLLYLKQEALFKFNSDKISKLNAKQEILRKIEATKNSDIIDVSERYSNRLNQEFTKYNTGTTSLKERVATFTAEYKANKVNREYAESLIKTLEEEVSKSFDLVVKLDNDIKAFEGQRKEYTKKIKSNKKNLEILSFWVEAFSQKGIRSFIFETSLPELSSRANYYSTVLTGGTINISILPTTAIKSTGGVKEKLNIIVDNSLGAKSYDGCSEGEKRRVDLCLLLALQDLVSSRGTKKWDTSFLDEVFDTLDNTGITAVIDLLRTESPNKSIYLISHNNDLKNLFDSAIVITKQDGVSTIC